MWFSPTFPFQLLMKNCRLIIQPSPAGKRCHRFLFRCLSLFHMANNPSFCHPNCFSGCSFCCIFASASYFWARMTRPSPTPSSSKQPWLASVPSGWVYVCVCVCFLPPKSDALVYLDLEDTHKNRISSGCEQQFGALLKGRGSFLTSRLVEEKPLTIMAPITGQLTLYWHRKLPSK